MNAQAVAGFVATPKKAKPAPPDQTHWATVLPWPIAILYATAIVGNVTVRHCGEGHATKAPRPMASVAMLIAAVQFAVCEAGGVNLCWQRPFSPLA